MKWIFLIFSVISLKAATYNITNYGGVGDCTNFYVNTTSNFVLVTTTNICSTNDIGKYIEIFGVGKITSGNDINGVATNDNQDTIAIVTNVVNSTNLYLNVVQLSGGSTNYQILATKNAWSVMGTDNSPIISNIVYSIASSDTNATIYIPNGVYLCLSRVFSGSWYGAAAIPIYRGGLKFEGESRNGSVLFSRGAWQSWGDGTYPVRGELFEIVAPITNNYDVIITNLTLNGGVQKGYDVTSPGIQINRIDGRGWDEQHDAILSYDKSPVSIGISNIYILNCDVCHWRGEMVKSIDATTNGIAHFYNVAFYDGQASALNFYYAPDYESLVFSNLFQIGEFYQDYYTHTGTIKNCYSTNIWANGWAFNGGLPWAPEITFESNVFYLNGYGNNAMLFEPASNIKCLNNIFYPADYMTIFNLSPAGAQSPPNAPSSNMVYNIQISGNIVTNSAHITAFVNAGGSDVKGVNGLTVTSNHVYASAALNVITAYNTCTNVSPFEWNTFNCPYGVQFTPTSYPYQYPELKTNNTYYSVYSAGGSSTNILSYGNGGILRVTYGNTGLAFVLKTTDFQQIPNGAIYTIDNQYNSGAGNIKVFLDSSTNSANSYLLANGTKENFYWNTMTAQWQTNAIPIYIQSIIKGGLIMSGGLQQ